MGQIRVAILGVGNCASSLIQGLHYYSQGLAAEGEKDLGLMHYDLGGYRPEDIEVVAAIDIDSRKVGKPLAEAIYAPPNCTRNIVDSIPDNGVVVQMGKVLDGISDHMLEYDGNRSFRPAAADCVDVRKLLTDTNAEILLNYLPVGSEEATRFYIESCLACGVSLVNCIPVFIVSEPEWSDKFLKKGIPCVGDDIKAQIGATIVHRTLTRLFVDRGAQLDRTYQLNTGGNTDFLNMARHHRLKSKRISKTDAVQSQLKVPLAPENVHIGPADYVPWQLDNKVCFLRMEGRGFAGIPLDIELRLSVEDSPNSAGVAIDAVRCCKLARDRGTGGPLESVSAYMMKHPPRQLTDSDARQRVEDFIAGKIER